MLWVFLAGLTLVSAMENTIYANPGSCSESPCAVNISWYLESSTPDGTVSIDYQIEGDDERRLGTFSIGEFGDKDASHVLPILDLRGAAYSFSIYSTADCDPNSLLATSPKPITFDLPLATPQYGRLSITNDAPLEYMVMFTSGYDGSTDSPTVRIGTSQSELKTNIIGITDDPFTADDMCNAPANESANFINPGYTHKVQLGSFKAGSKWYYQYGFGGDTDVWSEVYSFVVPNKWAANPKSPTHAAIIFGDMGVTLPFVPTGGYTCKPAYKSVELIKRLLNIDSDIPRLATRYHDGIGFDDDNVRLDTLLHIGDVSYAVGFPVFWEYFMSSIQDISTTVPYMVTIGNHEYDYIQSGQPFAPSWADFHEDSGGECGVPYSARFTMPAPPSKYTPEPEGKSNKSLKNLWYSYVQEPVLYVVMSAEHDFTVGSLQYEYLESVLSNVDRSITPWVVFISHRPLYTSEGMVEPSVNMIEHTREHIEPLILKYEVDVYISGHVHKYERSCNLKGNYTCASGMDQTKNSEHTYVHLVVGNAGNTFQLAWDASDYPSSFTAPYYFPQPEWSVFRSFEYGVSQFQANSTTFQFQFIGSKTYKVHDYFVLNK